jgi:glycine cleavage system regulatory protein
MTTSLVVTTIGDDRPGIVNALSDIARRFNANWAGSHLASLAGQFAGIVHLEVADAQAEPMIAALRGLDAMGLHVVIAKGANRPPAVGRRKLRLELVGHDRPGIVRELSGNLASIGVSIDEMHTQIVSAAMSGDQLFKLKALLAVPHTVADDALRNALEAIANEMMVDIEPAGESPSTA